MKLWRDLRTWLFTLLISLFLIVLGYVILGRFGLLLGLGASLIVSYIALFYDHLSLVKLLHAHPTQGRDPWGIANSIHHLAHKLNLNPQEVFIFHSPVPCSFVEITGVENGKIGLSDALIDKLSPAELHSILALAMAHIKIRGQIFSVLIERLAKVVIAIGQILDRLLFTKKKQVISRILYPLAHLHIMLFFSAKKIHACDQLASDLIPKAATLAEALWKIQNSTYAQRLATPIGTEYQFLIPTQPEKESRLQTHPPTKTRLKHLVGYYPI